MGMGNLLIQARTADKALPLGNVRIRIWDQRGSLLYDLLTDESGEAGPITLFAVDRSLSEDQNYRGTPYSVYNLSAEADGFESLYIRGVKMFDGETAIQPIELLPATGVRGTPATRTIDLGKQGVELNEPRNQQGTDVSPRVFGEVIIPDPITVHLGTPSASAQNVRVGFTDYIKNVASSEIYPTWPDSALRANIYAIISFVLNRVFTEWYRSKGYNFDITSSTAYDQSYQNGHVIYESVSRIVDEIFNQYVRREGRIEPYFTSFCNGTTSTCNGMSQWGTVDLANQGLDPLHILRSYYPQDIEIAETNIITGVTESYPGTALRMGSTGQAVERIQTYLNRIRRNYPAIPAITDQAGVFGSSTEAAVKQFQQIFNLAADGIVGKATWNKLSAIFVAVTKLAALDSEGTQLGIGTVPPSAVLRMGSSGVDVITLQYILAFLSSFYPNIPQIAQDGIFGSGTEAGVSAFQQMRGLPANGVVDEATWNALYETFWSIVGDVPFPGHEPGAEPGTMEYVVQPGDSLWLIAQRFGTTVNALKNLNNLTGDMIRVGQILMVPSDENMSGFEYTVRAGDSLWRLAQRFGTTVEAIKKLNGLTNDTLLVGQIVRIPGNMYR